MGKGDKANFKYRKLLVGRRAARENNTNERLQVHVQAPQAATLHGAGTWKWEREMAKGLHQWEREKLCKYLRLVKREKEDYAEYNRRVNEECTRRMRCARQNTIVENGLKKLFRETIEGRKETWEGQKSVLARLLDYRTKAWFAKIQEKIPLQKGKEVEKSPYRHTQRGGYRTYEEPFVRWGGLEWREKIDRLGVQWRELEEDFIVYTTEDWGIGVDPYKKERAIRKAKGMGVGKGKSGRGPSATREL